MVCKGVIQGLRTYSFTPEGSSKSYSGYTICVLRDTGPDDPEGQQGQFADVFSISFKDAGQYNPNVGDPVQYHLYRDASKKLKCGYILPL